MAADQLEPVASPLAEATPGLVGRVVKAVQADVRELALRPGAPLPSEGAYAAALGCSRPVVREGFRALAALGIVEVANGRRARVGKVEPAVLGLLVDHAVGTDQISIQQIYDVRRTIELRTVALAALRRTGAEAAAIAAYAAGMRHGLGCLDTIMAADLAFHRAIAGASRNPMFALLVGAFEVVTRQTWTVGWLSRPDDDARQASIACHERIAAAILAQDTGTAERAMAEHFDHSIRALIGAGIQ